MRLKLSGERMEYIYYSPKLSDEMLLLIMRNTERFLGSEGGEINIYSCCSLAEAMQSIEQQLSEEGKVRLATDIELMHQVIEYFDYMDIGEMYYDMQDV